MRKKDKKHSGWITPRLTIPKKELIKNDLYIEDYYDDWEDYRDGMRGYYDKTKIKSKYIDKQYIKKNKKLLKIRHAKKYKMDV